MVALRALDRLSAGAASVVRAGAGDRVAPLGARPAQPLRLWDFEACPFCRKVREAISMLDLDVLVYPCPKSGARFRGALKQFPHLVDPNAIGPDGGELALDESDVIVRYLFDTYGTGRAPLRLRLGPLTTATSALASAMRPMRGARARPSRAPDETLELWAHEASPESRLVRETLTELELPYLLHPMAHGSANRGDFRARWGGVEIPFLHDPGLGVSTYGATPIREHLERAYALPIREAR